MVNFLERYLIKLRSKNDLIVKEMSTKLQETYNPVARREFENQLWAKYEENEEFPEDMKFWNLRNIDDFNNSIYFDVAAIYLEDLSQNLGDYLSDNKDLLVDSQYATKLEERYLAYVAQKHQEKNESHSKKLKERIMDVQHQFMQNAEVDKNMIIQSHPITVSLLNERRQKEEDAKCLICNSGDYEEHDMIVFCGF